MSAQLLYMPCFLALCCSRCAQSANLHYREGIVQVELVNNSDVHANVGQGTAMCMLRQ